MKNIIIFGAGRSGKSMLADRINKKFGHHIVNGDEIMSKIHDDFPYLDINNVDEFKRSGMPRLISEIDNKIAQMEKINKLFVIEGVQLNMQHLSQNLDSKNYIFVCIAYPNETEENKLKNILRYNPPDWLGHYDLQKLVTEKICESKVLEQKARQLGIAFFDSTDFEKALSESLKGSRGRCLWSKKLYFKNS